MEGDIFQIIVPLDASFSYDFGSGVFKRNNKLPTAVKEVPITVKKVPIIARKVPITNIANSRKWYYSM